jgi:flagellar protein FlgJ
VAGSLPMDVKSLLGQSGAAQPAGTEASSEAARQRAQLKKATQDFEAVFVGLLLKQMRKSMTGGNALFGNSSEAKMYQDMLDDATSQQMSRSGGLGLGDLLYKKREATLPPDPAAPTSAVKLPKTG